MNASHPMLQRTLHKQFSLAQLFDWACRGSALTYFLLAVVTAAIAIPAFHRNGLIAGGDLWPSYFLPYDHHFQDSLSLWGTTISAIGSPQFEKDFTVYGAIGKILLALGMSSTTAEFIFFVLFWLCEVLGTAYLALALFPRRFFVAFTASMGIALSLSNILTFLQATELFAVGYYAFIAGFIIKKVRRNDHPLLIAAQTALLSLGLMPLTGNPSLAVFAVIWGLFWLIVVMGIFGVRKKVIAGFALGGFLALLVNSWWLYAAYVTLYMSGGTIQQNFAGPAAWSWVDARASFINLLTLKALWAWPQSFYFPWEGPYLHFPLNLALFVPALFAITGLIKREKFSLPLLLIIVVALFVTKGYHEPVAQINTFFYDHIPFFWLLRDPQVEIGIWLYLALFILAGLGISTIAHSLQPYSVSTFTRYIGIVLICLDGYAFVSGQFIPMSWLNGQAREVVTIPSYWYNLANYLNSAEHAGPVLMLPNDDFYQMPYTWGYYGTDEVAQSFLKSPVFILNAPNSSAGYISSGEAYNTFQNRLYQMIAQDAPTPIAPLLRTLGIHWIVERGDINWRMTGRHILSPVHIATYLSQQSGITKVATFGRLNLYEVVNAPSIVSIYGKADQLEKGQASILAQPCASGVVSLPPTVTERQHLICLATEGTLADSKISNISLPPNTSLLVLRQGFSPSWAVFLDGQRVNWPHEAIGGFLNGWTVPASAAAHQVDLVYLPALTFNRLRWLSLVTALFCVLAYCFLVVRRFSSRSMRSKNLEEQILSGTTEQAGSS